MCGIVGEVALSGTVDVERVRRRNDLIRHRGPDGGGDWVDAKGRCALAMRRLAIVDLAGGQQPMTNGDGTICVVFNGEIYNHVELRQALQAEGWRFRSDHSDTEVIVQGFAAWGAGLLERLRGMFGVAIWDARRGELLLARDRLGKKPVYWARAGRRLVFGSELRTLLADPDVSPRLDPGALDAYLRWNYIPAPHTLLAGVHRLPAGWCLTVRGDRIETTAYWRPTPAVDPHLTLDAAVAEAEPLLEEAVRLRMRADVPVGALLSGGLDSSLVVALAQRVTHRPLHTFSVGFREAGLDESAYAAQVATAIGSIHTPVTVDEVDEALLDRVVEGLDEPLGDPAAVPTFVVSEVARRDVTVVLTGEGGDEVFGGYDTYRRELALAGMLHVPQPLRALAAWSLGTVDAWRASGPSLYGPRLQAILGADAAGWHGAFTTRLHPATRRALYGPALDAAVQAALAASPNGHGAATADPVLQASLEDLAGRLPDGLLMKVDKMTMQHGLEARTPLLDHVLVEWAMRLPPALRCSTASGKLVLKQVAARVLPADIVGRPKHPFDVPIGRWLRGGLAGAARDACAPLERVGFSRPALDAMLGALEAGQDRAELPVWMLTILGRWLGRHPAVQL